MHEGNEPFPGPGNLEILRAPLQGYTSSSQLLGSKQAWQAKLPASAIGTP